MCFGGSECICQKACFNSLDYFQLLLAKFSWLLDGFLPFLQVTWLVVYALKLIHFSALVPYEIAQREECAHQEALLFLTAFFRSLVSSSMLFCN